MEIELVSAPEDYSHPEHDIKFKLHDKVQLPDGEICTIVHVDKGYTDRANKYHKRKLYTVDTKKPGMPIDKYFGYQLKSAPDDVAIAKRVIWELFGSELTTIDFYNGVAASHTGLTHSNMIAAMDARKTLGDTIYSWLRNTDTDAS